MWNFDATTWINDSFRDRPDEEALESYLASLAMKLHIVSQDYTDQHETGYSTGRVLHRVRTGPHFFCLRLRDHQNNFVRYGGGHDCNAPNPL